jgi:RimJ/RimL family protein N-acetyltransferase
MQVETRTMTDPLLIELPASLQTPRLLMRPPQAGDGPMVYEAVNESLPELRRFLASLPWVASDPTPESSEVWARNAQANFIARKDMPFLLLERSDAGTPLMVGVVGLHRPVWATPKFEVGYWVRTSKAGRGFVSEAVNALTELAMQQLRAARVELITDEDNTASRQVALRCGFVLEGTLRNERRAPDGTLRHACFYARTALNN